MPFSAATAPEPDRGTVGASRHWGLGRTAVVGAAALALAVGAAAAVNASSLGDGQGGGGPGGLRRVGGPFQAASPLGTSTGTGAGVAGALHGEFVTADGSGGYQTVRTQSGEVSVVDATSVTVRSPDDFTATYTITGDTVVGTGTGTGAAAGGIDDIDVGDTVQVTATVADGASADSDATATAIVEGGTDGQAAAGGQTAPGTRDGSGGQSGFGQNGGQPGQGSGQFRGQQGQPGGGFPGQQPGGATGQNTATGQDSGLSGAADPGSHGGTPPPPPSLAGPLARQVALTTWTVYPDRGRGGTETGIAVASA